MSFCNVLFSHKHVFLSFAQADSNGSHPFFELSSIPWNVSPHFVYPFLYSKMFFLFLLKILVLLLFMFLSSAFGIISWNAWYIERTVKNVHVLWRITYEWRPSIRVHSHPWKSLRVGGNCCGQARVSRSGFSLTRLAGLQVSHEGMKRHHSWKLKENLLFYSQTRPLFSGIERYTKFPCFP